MVLTREQKDEIKAAINVAIKEMWMDEAFIKTLVDKVSTEIAKSVNKKIAACEEEIINIKNDLNQIKTESNKKIDSLNSAINNLHDENKELLKLCDHIEQQNKRQNVRIFNFKEEKDENIKQEVIDLFNNKMQMQLTANNIEVCHRIGKTKEGKPRSIFLKLTDFQTKNNIFRKKKLLKGTGVVIKEDLTPVRLGIVNSAIAKTSLRDVWTENGKIIIKIKDTIRSLTTMDELSLL